MSKTNAAGPSNGSRSGVSQRALDDPVRHRNHNGGGRPIPAGLDAPRFSRHLSRQPGPNHRANAVKTTSQRPPERLRHPDTTFAARHDSTLARG